MANDLTPANMLREYRRQSDDATREQAELFKSLSSSDQREMLFYMISHAFKGLQYVHSRHAMIVVLSKFGNALGRLFLRGELLDSPPSAVQRHHIRAMGDIKVGVGCYEPDAIVDANVHQQNIVC